MHEQLRRYCLAALHTRLGDITSARDALDEMVALPAKDDVQDFINDLRVMIEARIAFAGGDFVTALDQLEQVREFRYPRGYYSSFFQRADARYLRARCLAELGRDEEALGWFDASAQNIEFLLIYGAFAHLGQAESLERLGRPADAASHYRSFVDLMDESDPEYAADLGEARARLQVLDPGR